MPGISPFADDWQDCLRAHYQSVIRKQDTVTERTLTGVLRDIGFTTAELAELRVLATMRADEVSGDYMPDLDAVEAYIEAVLPTEAEANAQAVLQAAVEAAQQQVEAVQDSEDALEADTLHEQQRHDEDEDAPVQMSLF